MMFHLQSLQLLSEWILDDSRPTRRDYGYYSRQLPNNNHVIGGINGEKTDIGRGRGSTHLGPGDKLVGSPRPQENVHDAEQFQHQALHRKVGVCSQINVGISCLKQVVAGCSQQVPYAAVKPHQILSSCTINYVSNQC